MLLKDPIQGRSREVGAAWVHAYRLNRRRCCSMGQHREESSAEGLCEGKRYFS